MQFNIGQFLASWGTLYLSAYQKNYWNYDDTEASYSRLIIVQRTWGSYGIQDSFNQRLLQQINIHHSSFANESLFLTLKQNCELQYENHTNSISSALYGQYRNQYTILKLGYNHDPHQNQLNYGLQGSLVAYPYGLTLAICETVALVIVKDAVGVKLENHSGIKTDY